MNISNNETLNWIGEKYEDLKKPFKKAHFDPKQGHSN